MRIDQIGANIQPFIKVGNAIPYVLPTLPIWCFKINTIDPLFLLLAERVEMFTLLITKI